MSTTEGPLALPNAGAKRLARIATDWNEGACWREEGRTDLAARVMSALRESHPSEPQNQWTLEECLEHVMAVERVRALADAILEDVYTLGDVSHEVESLLDRVAHDGFGDATDPYFVTADEHGNKVVDRAAAPIPLLSGPAIPVNLP